VLVRRWSPVSVTGEGPAFQRRGRRVSSVACRVHDRGMGPDQLPAGAVLARPAFPGDREAVAALLAAAGRSPADALSAPGRCVRPGPAGPAGDRGRAAGGRPGAGTAPAGRSPAGSSTRPARAGPAPAPGPSRRWRHRSSRAGTPRPPKSTGPAPGNASRPCGQTATPGSPGRWAPRSGPHSAGRASPRP
jgi:hypothetical protein